MSDLSEEQVSALWRCYQILLRQPSKSVSDSADEEEKDAQAPDSSLASTETPSVTTRQVP